MAFKRSFTESVPAQREKSFAKAGIECHHGTARLTGPTTVAVGDTQLKGRHINLAVYGDAAQANPPLTPVAGRDGEVVAANML